ncbi:MAG: hypothetical protein SLAVMIC_00090 [uncultured marine phage]|uniref:Uncharacterized protein n=1 Tax=uncultured marine phage TaxID=707152 RepID=A0A8D9FRU7_9VIRU|nr:MAG: hypothetical protein SLAVMIC_00090 [uncultured marine phage]
MSEKEKKDKAKDAKQPRVLSKHKESGKHSLKYDSIFKGKKEEVTEDDYTSGYFNNDFKYDPQSAYYHETQNNDEYIREKDLKEKVYKILLDETEINFMNNRRKPSKVDFNHYYHLLRSNLSQDSFTSVQIFNELAYYFSDNLFNMFKLLDSKWRDMIINELQDHIGKVPETSKDVTPRNLTIGAEIEFEIEDTEGDLIVITGVIIDTDNDEREYEVDSYENVYIVPIECITRILNNQKFKYNLNKLNNLDII